MAMAAPLVLVSPPSPVPLALFFGLGYFIRARHSGLVFAVVVVVAAVLVIVDSSGLGGGGSRKAAAAQASSQGASSLCSENSARLGTFFSQPAHKPEIKSRGGEPG